MENESILVWVMLSIGLMFLVLIVLFIIVPLIKTPEPVQLPISMLGAPFSAYGATLLGNTITVEVKNIDPVASATIQRFHLTFTSPSGAICQKELDSSATITPGMILPIKLEECSGFNVKKEKVEALVAITYVMDGTSEVRTSSGKIATFGPIE